MKHSIKGNLFFCLSSGASTYSSDCGKVGNIYFFQKGQEPLSVINPEDSDYKINYGSFVAIKDVSLDVDYDADEVRGLVELAAVKEAEVLQAGLDKLERKYLAKKQIIEARIASMHLLSYKAEDADAVAVSGDVIIADQQTHVPAAPRFNADEAEDVNDDFPL